MTSTDLTLTFEGRIGSFGSLNPATNTQVGTITWTVRPGSLAATPQP